MPFAEVPVRLPTHRIRVRPISCLICGSRLVFTVYLRRCLPPARLFSGSCARLRAARSSSHLVSWGCEPNVPTAWWMPSVLTSSPCPPPLRRLVSQAPPKREGSPNHAASWPEHIGNTQGRTARPVFPENLSPDWASGTTCFRFTRVHALQFTPGRLRLLSSLLLVLWLDRPLKPFDS